MYTIPVTSFKSHQYGAVATNLIELLQNYKKEDCHKLIDYLSEWASSFEIDRHVVESLTRKLESNFRIERYNLIKNDEIDESSNADGTSISDYIDRLNGSLYNYIKKIFLDNKNGRPELFMESILGEEDWKKIKEKISKRPPEYQEYIDNLINELTSKKSSEEYLKNRIRREIG